MAAKRYFDTELASKREETKDYREHLRERDRESQELNRNLNKLKGEGHSMVHNNPMVGGY